VEALEQVLRQGEGFWGRPLKAMYGAATEKGKEDMVSE
jgi:hypothetical protein